MSNPLPPEDPFGLVGRSLDGKYDIAAVVAEGGFGVVYRATHRALQKDVALKVLKVSTNLAAVARREFLEKFTLEARTIARFEHPNIVRVIDFGASQISGGEDTPWMVLEWLDGTSLESHLAALGDSRSSDPARALSLLGPVFEAIAYAHDEGIAHRDLKPANVMLRRSPRGELTIKVLDFGIAKLMGTDERNASGQTHTASALQAFSLHYAAPEQLTGMRTGPWTDVHALALMLVELLTGRPPFVGNDTAELYASALASQRPTPWARGIDVGAWEAVIGRALAFKPADRFPDARTFIEALRATLPAATWRSIGWDSAGVHSATTTPRPTTLRGAAIQTEPMATRSSAPMIGGAIVFVVIVLLGGAAALSSRLNPTSGRPPPSTATTSSATSAVSPVVAPVAAAPPVVARPMQAVIAADAAVLPARSPTTEPPMPAALVGAGSASTRPVGRHANRSRQHSADDVGQPLGVSTSTQQLPVE